MKLFALQASQALGMKIANQLGRELDAHEEREFSYGEHKARPMVSVRNEDVYVISSLHGDARYSVNDKICRLLFFIGALTDAGAGRVTAIIPYLAYSRKDKRTKARDPITTRYLATALQSVGTDRVVTMDIHNLAAFENSFRCPTVNLDTTRLFADYFYASEADFDSIVAPDFGAIKPTRHFVHVYTQVSGRILEFAVMDKRRSEGRVSSSGLIGATGKHVLIVDDMIGGGTTLCRATEACLEAGAERITAVATHGLFQNGAPGLFEQSGIETIAVTDTVAIENLGLPAQALSRLQTIGSAEIFARCIEDLRR